MNPISKTVPGEEGSGYLTIEDERVNFWVNKVLDRTENDDLHRHCLERHNPVKVASILMMLEERLSYRKIEAALHCNSNTIIAVRAKYADTLQERRKEFSRRFAVVAEMATDLQMKKMAMLDDDDEALMNTSLKDLALAGGIATDKGAMLEGMTSQIVEHRKAEAGVSDAFDFIMAAKERAAKKNEAIEAEIIL